MSSERTDGREGEVEYRGTGFKVSLVLIFITAALVLILAVQNTAPVTLEFLAWEVELPLFALLLGAGLLGVLLDELIGLVWRRQRRKRMEERAELDRLRAGRDTTTDAGDEAERRGTSSGGTARSEGSRSDRAGDDARPR
jgi:uncharacterized integral membrane protein